MGSGLKTLDPYCLRSGYVYTCHEYRDRELTKAPENKLRFLYLHMPIRKYIICSNHRYQRARKRKLCLHGPKRQTSGIRRVNDYCTALASNQLPLHVFGIPFWSFNQRCDPLIQYKVGSRRPQDYRNDSHKRSEINDHSAKDQLKD